MKNIILAAIFTVCISIQSVGVLHATPLRRPVSPTTPMFLFQVQQPDASDPQACINAVPPDVRPYTVMEYCIGAQSGTVTNGYAMADYFCNVCEQNGMWCMIQCSSGYANTMDNLYTTNYATLLQKYPNLIGFSFAEQNWGFGNVSTTSEYGPSTFADRLSLFTQLLMLCNGYGGYLYVSEMQSISNPSYDPIAKFKADSVFRNATMYYETNYIVGDKFTSGQGYYDNESETLGVFLSGHAGNYAVRFDEYAWPYTGRSQLYGLKYPSSTNGELALFSCPEPAQGIPIVDHLMLQGATVIDGPEVPRYSTIYQGQLTPCYKNMTGDIFREVLNGTIKIPSLSDVLAHTPIAYVCNQNNNLTGGIYDGLYQIDGDGTSNHDWFKASGRYSSVPGIFNSPYELSFFTTNVLQSQYSFRWPTLASKIDEFNSYFPPVSTGTAFVARRENRLFTYNNYLNSNVTESASIPLQYNTCTNLSLTYSPQTFATITESNKSLQIYFNNYLTDKNALYAANYNTGQVLSYAASTFISSPPDNTTNTIRTNVFQISGCTNTPTYTLTDRGSHPATTSSSTFAGGVFTLTLVGNGPCDITINCAGSAVRTNTIPAPNVMVPPPDFVPDVPFPPNGVTATPGSGQATISWHATNCLYYNIKRGPTVNGPFTNIVTGITNAVNLYSSFNGGATVYNTSYSYVDSGLAASNTYYYVVSAVNTGGEGANSAVASATIVSAYNSIGPVADAYVRDGSSANSNFGSDTSLVVKNDSSGGSGFNRITFLKFNVAALTNALSATLVLVPNFVDTIAPTLAYQWETNDTWTENGITWNNMPTDNSGVIFTNLNGYSVGTPVYVDVTSKARSQATNDGLLSIRITSLLNAYNADVFFCSKEYATASWRPALVYSLPASIPPVINSFSLAGGQPQLSVSGAPSSYTLLTSTNLVDWQPLLTTNLVFFPYTFVDTNLPPSPARFYRIQVGQ